MQGGPLESHYYMDLGGGPKPARGRCRMSGWKPVYERLEAGELKSDLTRRIPLGSNNMDGP